MKDWIEQGSPLLYSPWLSNVAQSGPFLFRPSDREGNLCADSTATITRFTVGQFFRLPGAIPACFTLS